MKNIFSQRWGVKWVSALCAILAMLATSINLGSKSTDTEGLKEALDYFFASARVYDISKLFLLIMFYVIFLYAIGLIAKSKTPFRDVLCAGIPAALFGIFMSLGYSYKSKGNWSLVFGNKVQWFKAGLYSTGYTILFFFSIIILFELLDKADVYRDFAPKNKRFRVISWYLDCFDRKPLATAFWTMFVCYIPYMIISYPGILMGDTYSQVAQSYNISTYSTYFDFINKNYKLNNHHPVAHTVLISVCLKTGELLHSQNFGLFLYSFLQMLFVLFVLAWAIASLKKLGISKKILLLLMVYYVLHPRINNYMYLMTKDVIFSGFLVLFMVTLFTVLFRKEEEVDDYGMLMVGAVGAMLFRNDGFYIVFLTMAVVLVLFWKKWKQFSLVLMGILAFYFFWNSLFLPGMQITAGGRRELMSLFAQQTARYVRDAGDEVTEEEKVIIDKVFNYNKMAEKYDPTYADPIKNSFREKTATKEDLINYFKVWLQMFFKHPEIYMEATLHHKYDMFYINYGMSGSNTYSWSEEQMEILNNLKDDVLDMNLYYPKSLKLLRDWYEYMRENIFSLPVLNLFRASAAYINVFIIWMFYGLRKGSKLIFSISVPIAVQLLIIIAGPCSGNYSRYVYPIMMVLPFMILVGLHHIRKEVTMKVLV